MLGNDDQLYDWNIPNGYQTFRFYRLEKDHDFEEVDQWRF